MAFLVIITAFFIKPFLTDRTMTAQFKANKTAMEILADMLIQDDSQYIHISNTWISGLPKTKEYRLGNLAYNLIDKQNLRYIEKHQQTVFFCYRSRLMTGIGIAYTADGRNPKSRNGEMISIKKIENNWFYCELD